MKVKIRPKFTESIQGRNQYKIINGKREGTTKAPGGTTTLFIGDRGDGKLNIGFDKMRDNPYKKGGRRLPSNWRNKGIEELDEISVQTYFEIKHNVKEDYYNPRAYVLRKHNPEPRTFLQQQKIVLKDGTTVFDTDNPVHELFVEYFKHSKIVANSREEADASQSARFYVFDAGEEAETKLSRTEILENTIAKWVEIKNVFLGDKLYNFAILVDPSIKGQISPTAIKIKMNQFITDSGKLHNMTFAQRIEKFNAIYELATAKDKVSKLKFQNSSFLQNLVNHRIVSDYQNTYRWITKQGSNLEILGRDEEEVLDWMSNTDNKKYMEELKSELTARI